MSNLNKALELAARGIPVLPCDHRPDAVYVDKEGRVKKLYKAPIGYLAKGGVDDATADPEVIRRWWTQAPHALIAMPCGKASGIDAIDVEAASDSGKVDGRPWMETNGGFPESYTYTTASGGQHILVPHDESLGSVDSSHEHGIEYRSTGSYIVRWDLHRGHGEAGRILDASDPTALPFGLRAAFSGLGAKPASEAGKSSLENRLPPSIDAVVRLLDAIPNPKSTNRDLWVGVKNAAHGCIQAFEEAAPETDHEALARIRTAANNWAYRYGDSAVWDKDAKRNVGALHDGTDEEANWDDKIEPYPARTGWQALLRHAETLAKAGKVDMTGLLTDLRNEARAQSAERALAEFDTLPVSEDIDREPDRETGPTRDVAPSHAEEKPGEPLFHMAGTRPYGLREWRVASMLPKSGVAILSGQWGVGKTFVGLDLAVCLAMGRPFMGKHETMQCGVLWLAAEGEIEIPDRLDAACAAHGVLAEELAFAWSDRFPLVLDRGAEQIWVNLIVAAARSILERGAELGVVFLDTLGLGAGWTNEDSSAEGNAVMKVLKSVAKRTGLLVVVVDHYGKSEGSGTRGTSAKEANAESVLACLGERSETGEVRKRRLVTRKVRGGPAGKEYPFALRPMTVGQDAAGNPVVSCSLDWNVQADEKIEATKGQTALIMLVSKMREQCPNSPLTITDLLDKAIQVAAISKCNRERDRRREVKRMLGELHGRQLVVTEDGVWLASDRDAPMVMPDGSVFGPVTEAD